MNKTIFYNLYLFIYCTIILALRLLCTTFIINKSSCCYVEVVDDILYLRAGQNDANMLLMLTQLLNFCRSFLHVVQCYLVMMLMKKMLNCGPILSNVWVKFWPNLPATRLSSLPMLLYSAIQFRCIFASDILDNISQVDWLINGT